MRGVARAGLALLVVAGASAAALALWHGAGTPPPEQTRAASVPAPGRRVTVEVLNAGGRPGAARDATQLLRRDGFDVVYFGNAGKFGRDSSLVLDRVGDLANARAVAQALGIHDVRSEPDTTLYLDVSVILGKRWLLPGMAADSAPAGRLPLWDLRRWLGR